MGNVIIKLCYVHKQNKPLKHSENIDMSTLYTATLKHNYIIVRSTQQHST